MKKTDLKRKTALKRTGFKKAKKKPKSKLQKKKDNPNSNLWKKKCDVLWSLIVRQAGCCEMCGKRNCKLDAHHLITRGVRLYRHDLRNGICLCANCHQWDVKTSAHGAPLNFFEELRKIHSDKWFFVEDHRHDPRPQFFETYKEIHDRLEAIYDSMEGNQS